MAAFGRVNLSESIWVTFSYPIETSKEINQDPSQKRKDWKFWYENVNFPGEHKIEHVFNKTY